jgi:hypothetical protein
MCERHRNEMNSYDFVTKTYKYSEDPEIVRNRKNKSVLILTDRDFQPPVKSLHQDVSFPEQVKCLSIYCEESSNIFNLFKNLALFHNLQYFYAQK